MAGPAGPVVRSRLVVHIHGYQLTAPERFHRGFVRDLATFGTTWSVGTEAGPADVSARQAHWPARAHGPNWSTRTDYRLIRLDDLIAEGHRKPLLKRIVLGLRGLLDFVLDRAIVGYFRFGWRYALFTLAPLVMMAASVLLAVLVGRWMTEVAGPWLAGFCGLLAFAAMIAVFSKKLFLFILLEDWAFASILARRLEPEIAARLDEGSGDVRAAMASGAYDEILLIGHSLGAVMILHLAERVLDGMPGGGEDAASRPRMAMLTIGSSALKIGLHSKAEALRRATAAVTSSARLIWADYWSHHDVMNFPRVDPATAMGLRPRFPTISRKAVFREMVSTQTLNSLRFDFFRKHNLFFHAATCRSGYDYFMFVCGPFFCGDLARSPDGAVGWIGRDGDYRASAPEIGPEGSSP